LARDHTAHGHFAVRRDGELEHQLSLQLRVVAQRARIEAVDTTLVAIEDQLDLLARARGLAPAPARGGPAGIEARLGDAGAHRRGLVAGERARPAAEAAAGIGRGYAARAGAHLGGDERALGMTVRAYGTGKVLGLEVAEVHDIAQVGELVLDLIQLLLRLLVGALVLIDRRRLHHGHLRLDLRLLFLLRLGRRRRRWRLGRLGHDARQPLGHFLG